MTSQLPCGVSALAKSSAAETNSFCVIETHSQHFIRAPAGRTVQCEGISRKFLHPTAMETLGSRPVGLGSAELEVASLATQLESRRSLVPEKLQSTRVSLSTLGHASPDSWQLPLAVHSWVLD